MAGYSAEAYRALEVIFNELRVIETDFPASYASVLLHVARAEASGAGHPSVSEIGDTLGLSRPTASRIVLSMSNRRLGRSKPGEERPDGARKSLGLFERLPDPVDLRVTRVRLTPKGKGLVTRLTAALGAGIR